MSQLPQSNPNATTREKNPYGATPSRLVDFLGKIAQRTPMSYEEGFRVAALGNFTSSQDDREVLGPIIVRFLVERVAENSPEVQRDTLVDRGETVVSALNALLEDRRTPEGKASFKTHYTERAQTAMNTRQEDPLTDAALYLAHELRQSDAGVAAQDVVLTLGKLAQESSDNTTAGSSVIALPERRPDGNGGAAGLTA